MNDQLEMLQDWNKMLQSLENARSAWKSLQERKCQIDSTGVDSNQARAMTISIHCRSFDLLLPDLVRYWRTHGGFDLLVVNQELIAQFKPKKEKEDDRKK